MERFARIYCGPTSWRPDRVVPSTAPRPLTRAPPYHAARRHKSLGLPWPVFGQRSKTFRAVFSFGFSSCESLFFISASFILSYKTIVEMVRQAFSSVRARAWPIGPLHSQQCMTVRTMCESADNDDLLSAVGPITPRARHASPRQSTPIRETQQPRSTPPLHCEILANCGEETVPNRTASSLHRCARPGEVSIALHGPPVCLPAMHRSPLTSLAGQATKNHPFSD